VAARPPGVWLQESTKHKLLGFATLLHIKRKDLKMEMASTDYSARVNQLTYAGWMVCELTTFFIVLLTCG
jgi:hypothetical protein